MKNRKIRVVGADLVGVKKGRLTVVENLGLVTRKTTWRCVCECGGEKILTTGGVNSPFYNDCGCVARANPLFSVDAQGRRIRTPGYHCWLAMKSRCLSAGDTRYHKYGGRGITICDRWLGPDGFKNFLTDMGPRPSDKHSIGRRHTDDNYGPDTCRWETPFEQGQNKRNARLFTHNGKTQTITAWGRELGLAVGGFHDRLRKGWTVEEILSTPNMKKRQTRVESESAASHAITKRELTEWIMTG